MWNFRISQHWFLLWVSVCKALTWVDHRFSCLREGSLMRCSAQALVTLVKARLRFSRFPKDPELSKRARSASWKQTRDGWARLSTPQPATCSGITDTVNQQELHNYTTCLQWQRTTQRSFSLFGRQLGSCGSVASHTLGKTYPDMRTEVLFVCVPLRDTKASVGLLT